MEARTGHYDSGNDNPRELLFNHGAGKLTDVDLLICMVSGGAVRGNNEVPCRRLIERFGGLHGVLNASAQECLSVQGIGPSTIARLQAAREIVTRSLAERMVRDGPLDSPERAGDYFIAALRDEPREVFACVFLDTRHRVIGIQNLFYGTIDGATVHPREVVRQTLLINAAALIVAHQHPSGLPDPSQADIALTSRLRDALGMVDVRLLDHLVIGGNEVVSMASRGLI